MRIKRFEAADTQSAMAMVKEELGDEAVILSTRTLTDKSGSGRKKPRIEVVAAMEYDEHEPQVVVGPMDPEESELVPPAKATYGYHTLRRKQTAPPEEAAKRVVEQPVKAKNPGPAPSAKPQNLAPSPAAEDRIHLESNDLRLRFAHFLKQRYCPEPEPEERNVLRRPPEPGETRISQPDPRQVALWREQLIDQLRVAPLSVQVGEGPVVLALIGPTGVGKTTTAAKIAAWYSIHEGLQVALLSMDCYRIGATDQLRTYAKIMRLPCEIALRKKDLQAALFRHRDKDLIIVDTAGKSPYDPHHIEELRDWFAPCGTVESHLVLSATYKKEDLQHILKVYQDLPIKGLVLSKLDETRAYAALCQQLSDSPLPISCLCTGQRVPEDFLLASHDFLHALFGQGWQAATEGLAGSNQERWTD